MSELKIWINDQEVKAKTGQTVLKAATDAGIYIPTLCYHPALEPNGSCRLCAVEIKGYRGLPPACSTEVEDGMRIWTQTAKIRDFRREILRLILQDHPRECLGCPRNGTCELQKLVAEIGIDFPYQPPTGPRPPAKGEGAYFERDYALCVHCGRCVRICHEVRGARAIVIRETEGRPQVGTPLDLPLEETGCQFCGACVDVCPTGALRENLTGFYRHAKDQVQAVCPQLTDIVLDLYKKELPTRQQTFICPGCSAGCRLVAEVTETDEIVWIKPDTEGPANEGQACVQGRFLLKGYAARPERILKPMIKKNGSYETVGWPEALGIIVERFKSYRPNEIAFLTDGRATNEELYLFQKFARTSLGTDQLGVLEPAGSRKTARLLEDTLGTTAITFSLEDLSHAPVILSVGLNPPATHPIAGTRIRDAVMKGSRLIVANPLEVNSARFADLHLRYVPGTEAEIMCGLIRQLIDQHGVDPGVLAESSSHVERLRRSLEPYDSATVSGITGVPPEDIIEAGRVMAGLPGLALLFGPSLLNSAQGEDAVMAMITLLQLKGSFGSPGQGLAPLYGASNVQGAWQMGWRKDILKTIKEGKTKALYLALETYNEDYTQSIKPYLKGLEFVVLQDVVFRDDKDFQPDIILPMRSLLEKDGTLTSLDRLVQWTESLFSPAGDVWSLDMVAARWAESTGVSLFRVQGAEAALVELSRETPAYRGVTPARAKWEPVHIPCPSKNHPGTPCLFRDSPPTWPQWIPKAPGIALEEAKPEDETFPFLLLHQEYLVPFSFGPLLAPEAKAFFPENAAIQMNPGEVYRRGWSPGDNVWVIHREGEFSGKLALNRLLPPRMVVVPAERLRVLSEESCKKNFIYAVRVEKR